MNAEQRPAEPTPLCEENGCDLPAAHMWKEGSWFAFYCASHFAPHEAARLQRCRR